MLTVSIKNYSAQLLQTLDNQRHHHDHCDVVLISRNGAEYHAHSSVLAASSNFLNEQLKVSSMTKQVSLADHNGDIIGMFLEVLYTGKLELDSNQALANVDQLKNLAAMIDVQSVVELCNKYKTYADKIINKEAMVTQPGLKQSRGNVSRMKLQPNILHGNRNEQKFTSCESSVKSNNESFKQQSMIESSADSSSELRNLLKQSLKNCENMSDHSLVKMNSNEESVTVTKETQDSASDVLGTDDLHCEEVHYEGESVPLNEDSHEQSVSKTEEKIPSIGKSQPENNDTNCLNTVSDVVLEQKCTEVSVDSNEKKSISLEPVEAISEKPDDRTEIEAMPDILSAAVATIISSDLVNMNQDSESNECPLQKSSSDESLQKPTPKRQRGRPKKITLQEGANETSPKIIKSEPTSKKSKTKDADKIILSPTGRPRRKAAENNIYIGKPKPLITEKDSANMQPESESDEEDVVQTNVHTKRRSSRHAEVQIKQESSKANDMSADESTPDVHLKRKRGRPPKSPLSSPQPDTPAAKKPKRSSRRTEVEEEEESYDVLFEDDEGDVYIELGEVEKPSAVYECFSKITSQLLKYQMEGGPEKDAAAIVAGYMEDLEDFEIADGSDVSHLKQKVHDTFQTVLDKIAEVTGQLRSEDEDNEPQQKKPPKAPTGDQYTDWKNCKYCSKFKGRKKGRYEFHLNYCYSDFKCDLCSKPFLNEHDLNKHHCNKMDRWICDLCGKILSDKPTLQLHRKNHMGIKTKVCSFCGKTFMRSCHLQSHIAHVHKKERPYRCTECDAAFALNYELNRHMQKHSETPNFTCTECGVSFYERIKLNHHIKTKHKSRNVECLVECPADVEPTTTILLSGVDDLKTVQHVNVGENQVEIEAAVDQIIQTAGVIEQKDGEDGTEVQIVLHSGGLLYSYGYDAYQAQT